MWSTEKKKVIDTALSQIEKQFGRGSIMKMNEKTSQKINVSSSGNLAINIALGIGGYPAGRIIEVYGPESSGKTTLALHAIAEVQKNAGVAAFIDAEHALDIQYAKKLGVNVDDLLLSQPDYGEQALEIAEILIRSGAISIIVIDSVAALVPKSEISGEMGDHHMALQARLMSQALRKITALCSKSGCIVIFINQLRQKIGVIFGNPEVTTGGNALKFYSSIRLDIRRIASIKQGDQVVGNRTRIKVVKNKMAPPFGTTEVDILFNQGISHLGSMIDLATDAKIIEKSGSWFAFKGEKLAQGKENVRQVLIDNKQLAKEIEQAILKFHNLLPNKDGEAKTKTQSESNASANNDSIDDEPIPTASANPNEPNAINSETNPAQNSTT